MRERQKPLLVGTNNRIRPASVLMAVTENVRDGRRTSAVGVREDFQRSVEKYFVVLPKHGTKVSAGCPHHLSCLALKVLLLYGRYCSDVWELHKTNAPPNLAKPTVLVW